MLNALRADLGTFKAKIREEIESMGLQLKTTESTLSNTCTRIEKLEQELHALKLQSKHTAASNTSAEKLTIVMGSIPGASTFEQALEWITKRCVTAGVPQPIESFMKSDAYKNVMFAKCSSVSHRDQVISAIRSSQMASGVKAWAKIDQPIDVRTAEGALFAFKKLLTSEGWGFNAKAVYVNTDKLNLSVAGTEILQAKVVNGELKLAWCDGEWETWEELQSAAELTKIRKDAQDKLDRSKSFFDKGKGKSSQ